MHISLDRNGRVVQAGEGSFRVPMGADEVDNTLSNPVSQAANLEHRNRLEYATMAAEADDQAARAANIQARQRYMANMAREYEEYASAEEVEANGGENPLIYLAAMQTMAGGGMEYVHPLMGHMLAEDGSLAFDRAMNGDVVESFGQSTQDLIQAAQAAVPAAQALYSQAQPYIAAATGATGPAAGPGAPSAPSVFQDFMKKQIAGYPAPLVVGAGLLAFLILRRK